MATKAKEQVMSPKEWLLAHGYRQYDDGTWHLQGYVICGDGWLELMEEYFEYRSTNV